LIINEKEELIIPRKVYIILGIAGLMAEIILLTRDSI